MNASKIRGSVMLSVIIFSSVMLVLVASLLSWGVTEKKLNGRSQLRLESRNAAEALAEFGFSQIRQKFETRSSFSLDPDGSDALQKPATAFWTGSNVDEATVEVVGGTIIDVKTPGSDYYFVDPADPNNEFDPLKGKFVFRRDVRVLGKATVVSPSGGAPIASYVTERISVRGAPLFAHAIFYNMDLEIFNGPPMVISGPVHTNGNLYLYPGNGSSLTFSAQVTATGNIYHAKKPGDGSADGASAAARTGSINFLAKSGSANLWDGSVWNDSTRGGGTSAAIWTESPTPGFRAYASQTWNGNLQTASHGVSNYTPVAIGAYVEDPTPSNGADNSVNSGRAIIEPTNYPTTDPGTDPNHAHKMAVEEQKYANNAGLYIKVDQTTGIIEAFSRNKGDPTKNKPLTLPATGLVELKTYSAVANYTTTNVTKTYEVSTTGTGSNAGKKKYKLRTITSTAPSSITYTSGGSAITTGAYTQTSNTLGGEGEWLSSPPANPAPTTTGNPPAETAATRVSGMYDNHRDKFIDIVELDMDGLRKAVAGMVDPSATSTTVSTGTGAVSASNVITGLDKTTDWTGIVYVEVVGGPTTVVSDSEDPNAGTTIAATNPNSLKSGLRIINGKGKVPSYVGDNSSEGLTIATNVPVYIKGHFNADGTATTSSPNSATTSETGETPAAIVGDAITILSADFSDATSKSSSNPTATMTTVEISAAMLTGLTPSNKNGVGNTSGGAHNLPRFLENWSGKKVFIRGSLVALFESRIFTEPHNSSGYYSPPDRLWGFNDLFKSGRYPPGTPRVMSYRRVDFTNLSSDEYNTIKASFSWD